MLSGELYDPNVPELSADRRRAKELLIRFNRTMPGQTEERRAVLGELFGSLGPGAVVEPPFQCDYGINIHAGERLYINVNCVFLDCGRLEIGNHVLFGPAVQVYTVNHPLQPGPRSEDLELTAPVRIEDNVWIGGSSVVVPGVTIGKNSVIGAGSVVTRDVPPNVVAVGNPCRVLKPLPE
jgi:acetyltransferase-like isoleucine patch superfamily enzyme